MNGLKEDDPVCVLPVGAPSPACALGDIELNLPPEAFRLDTAKLTEALDLLVTGAFCSGEKENPDWARKLWSDIVVGEEASSAQLRRGRGQAPVP